MAKYKVWLTVKDGYGNTKEIEGGTINVDLDKLTQPEIDIIEEALPLEDYLKKSEINTELDHYATDTEVDERDSLRYAGFTFTDNGGN